MDVGTGSGILTLAAAKLGAGEMAAIDSSEDAVAMAERNARLNGLNGTCRFSQCSADAVQGEFDLIVANLVPSVLIKSAKKLTKNLTECGVLVVAGFSDNQTPSVMRVLTKARFTAIKSYSREGWSALMLSRT